MGGAAVGGGKKGDWGRETRGKGRRKVAEGERGQAVGRSTGASKGCHSPLHPAVT